MRRDAAIQITIHDLRGQASETTIDKLYFNPLRHSFSALSEILLPDSNEAQEREAKKSTEANVAKDAKGSTTAEVPSIFQSTLHRTQHGISGLRTTPTPETPTKRKVSETSFRGRPPKQCLLK